MIRNRTAMLDKIYQHLDRQKATAAANGVSMGNAREDIHQAIKFMYPDKTTGNAQIQDKNFLSKVLGEHHTEPVLRSATNAGKARIAGSGTKNLFESVAQAAGVSPEQLRSGGYISPANINKSMPFMERAKEILRLAGHTARRTSDRTVGILPSRRLASGARVAGLAAAGPLLLQLLQKNPDMAENTLREFKDLKGNTL